MSENNEDNSLSHMKSLKRGKSTKVFRSIVPPPPSGPPPSGSSPSGPPPSGPSPSGPPLPPPELFPPTEPLPPSGSLLPSGPLPPIASLAPSGPLPPLGSAFGPPPAPHTPLMSTPPPSSSSPPTVSPHPSGLPISLAHVVQTDSTPSTTVNCTPRSQPDQSHDFLASRPPLPPPVPAKPATRDALPPQPSQLTLSFDSTELNLPTSSFVTVPCPTYGSLPSTPNRPQPVNPADSPVTNMAATYSTYCVQPSVLPETTAVATAPIYSTYSTHLASGNVFPSLDSKQSIPLAKFVEDHQKSFPTCVQVVRGYCGSTERDVVSAGDIYNFHFVKRTEVIHIEDSKGTKYSIPLNSAVQCGIVYGPSLNTSGGGEIATYSGEACTFGSIGELMAANPLPWLVRAIGSHQASDARSVVEENELFIVTKTTRKMRRFGQQSLKVYSLTHQESKVLHSDCPVSFTANPLSVLLYPPEIMLHFPKAFPMKAVLYFGNEAENIPEQLLAEVVTLVRHSVERSVIVTSCLSNSLWVGGGVTDVGLPMEIPVQLDIEVVAVPSELVEKDEQLCAQTRSLLKDFNPSKIRSCGGGNGTQAFQALRQGYESVGLELEPPSALYSEIKPRLLIRPANNLPHPPPPLASAQIPPPLPANAPPARRQIFSSSTGDLPSLVRAQPTMPASKLTPGVEEEEGENDDKSSIQGRSVEPPVASRPQSDGVVDNTLYGASDLSVQVHVVRRMVETMQNQVDMAESMGRKNGSALMAAKSEIRAEMSQLASAVDVLHRQLGELRELVCELMQRSAGCSGIGGSGRGVPILSVGNVPPFAQPVVSLSVPAAITAGADSSVLQTTAKETSNSLPPAATLIPSSSLPMLSAANPTSLSSTASPRPPVTTPRPPITTPRPSVITSRPSITSPRPPTTSPNPSITSPSVLTTGITTTPAPAMVSNSKAYTSATPTSSSLDTLNRTANSKEENKESLKKFDHLQVLKLLENMGLKQYQDKFKSEQINGELLVSVTEEDLQKDLGIATKLHRVRLMKMIDGSHSALQLLEGANPYEMVSQKDTGGGMAST